MARARGRRPTSWRTPSRATQARMQLRRVPPTAANGNSGGRRGGDDGRALLLTAHTHDGRAPAGGTRSSQLPRSPCSSSLHARQDRAPHRTHAHWLPRLRNSHPAPRAPLSWAPLMAPRGRRTARSDASSDAPPPVEWSDGASDALSESDDAWAASEDGGSDEERRSAAHGCCRRRTQAASPARVERSNSGKHSEALSAQPTSKEAAALERKLRDIEALEDDDVPSVLYTAPSRSLALEHAEAHQPRFKVRSAAHACTAAAAAAARAAGCTSDGCSAGSDTLRAAHPPGHRRRVVRL